MANEIWDMDKETFCIFGEDSSLVRYLENNPRAKWFGYRKRNGVRVSEFFFFPASDYDDIAKLAGIKPVKQHTAKQQEQ